MNMKLYIALALLAVCLVSTALGYHHHGLRGAGRRGHGRGNGISRLRPLAIGGRGGYKRRLAGLNIWMRTLSPGITVMEKGFVKRTTQMVFVKSVDDQLIDEGINPSISAYDFQNNMVAVRTRLDNHIRRTCMMLPGSLLQDSYGNTAQDVMDRKIVDRTEHVGEFTMVGGGPLTHSQVQLLNSSHPELMSFCHGRPGHRRAIDILDVTQVVNYDTDLRDTRPVLVLTMNGIVTMRLRKLV